MLQFFTDLTHFKYFRQPRHFIYNNSMQKLKSLKVLDLTSSEKYLNTLFTPKALLTQDNLNTQDQESKFQQKKKLNEIFVKTKKERIRDLFIQKLKRRLISNKPCFLEKKVTTQGLFGIKIEAIQFPEHLAHLIILINLIVMIVLIVLAVLNGFIDNFHTQRSNEAVLALQIICLVGNVLYFFLKCSNKSFQIANNNTSFIHNILFAYAKSGRLFLDLITILFQIATIIFPNEMAISGVFFFFLIIVLAFTLVDLVRIQMAYLKSEKSILIWGLIKVCLSNIMIAHLMAGFILAMSRIDLQENWMTKAEIQNQQWWVIYFYAFYWGTTIMMTVGFGDMLPGNHREVIITAFLQMFSCIVLGYNISQIGHLVSQLRRKNETTNTKLAIFQRMINQNGRNRAIISDQLKRQVIKHIKQVNGGQADYQYQQRDQLLAQLPQHLRRAYRKQANQRLFPSVQFFNRLKPQTWEKLAQKFTSKPFFKGQNLMATQDKIMILQKGEIGYGYKKRGSQLNSQVFDSLKINQGKSQLLTTTFLSLYKQRNSQLIAKDSALIWIILYQQLVQILKQSSIDFQYLFSVKHKHSIDQNQWCPVKCLRCTTQSINSFHTVFSCPRIVYHPIRQFRMLKQIRENSHKQIFIRRPRLKSRNQFVKKSVLIFRIQYKRLLQQYNVQKKIAQPKLQNVEAEMSRFYNDEVEQAPKKSKIVEYNHSQLQRLLEKTIKKCETGYEDGFWELQSDVLFNYQFYFPNENANRLTYTKIQDNCKENQRFIFKKRSTMQISQRFYMRSDSEEIALQ